jgi:membrane protease YdiL (CAAX protease family)
MREMVVTPEYRKRLRAFAALLLLAPVPSIGVVAAMVVAPGPIGHAVFVAAKVWLLVFPAVWYLKIEKGPLSWSPPHRGGLGAGALSGLGIAAAIVLGAWLAGIRTIDTGPLRAAVEEMGLGTPGAYLAAAAGWTLANSLVEEYVYRWFVLRQCKQLFSTTPAILMSAAVFTLHHVIAVSRYLNPVDTVVASTGVFIGGVIWAGLCSRYRSIWPGWISHVLADVAVFGAGWRVLFG